MKLKSLPTIVLLVLLSQAAAAEAIQSAKDIMTLAESYVLSTVEDEQLQDIQATAAPLDARLRLRQCSEPLQAFSTGSQNLSARSTVGIRCTGDSPWTLYVPVTLSAMSPVVISNRPIMRGELLTEADLDIHYLPLNQLPRNALASKDQAIGMEVARTLPAEAAISLYQLRAPKTIVQGQEVIIKAEGGGIAVRMSGQALSHGKMGDMIPVKNASSGRTLEGRIVSKDTVLVSF